MMSNRAAAVMLTIGIALLPMDEPTQCDDDSYRRAHPAICGQVFPFPDFNGGGAPRGGGGDDGGLLGRILHGLTGGLL